MKCVPISFHPRHRSWMKVSMYIAHEWNLKLISGYTDQMVSQWDITLPASFTYPERPFMRTLKWINGNCITPSFSLDWLVFKFHNAHEKQVALLSGYVQNTPDSFSRNDKWKCLSAPGFYLELHAPVIKIKPTGKIFINNNDDQMNCSSVIFPVRFSLISGTFSL